MHHEVEQAPEVEQAKHSIREVNTSCKIYRQGSTTAKNLSMNVREYGNYLLHLECTFHINLTS